MMLDKELLGYVSIFFALLSHAPYIYSMIKGKTCPHVFSWIVWGIAMGITFAAQYSANSGAGAWATALSAALAFVVVGLSLMQKADWSITRNDWLAFVGALAIIPLWFITQSALVAVVLATLIDSIAYYPTLRKSYEKPHQEMAFFYFTANLKHIASIFAITQYSATTLVTPITMLVMNSALIAILLWRRRVVALAS